MRRLVSYLVLLCFIGCNSIAEEPSQIIKRAKLIKYNQLSDSLQDIVLITNYSLTEDDKWQSSKAYDAAESYFIEAVINNSLVAKYSATSFKSEKEILGQGKADYLYGPIGENEFIAKDKEGEIMPTTPLSGFDLLQVIRSGEVDTIYVGPIPTKPVEFGIRFDGDAAKGNEVRVPVRY